jgi:hypothetical protein
MNLQFQQAAEAVPKLFEDLMSSVPFEAKGIVSQKRRAGIYLFLEGGKPVHIGRTRDLGGRLRGHITRSHYSASFAFKRTRVIHGAKATYITKGSRKDLAADPIFQTAFYEQIDLVKRMQVKFIEVPNPIHQYLLELYAHLELGLELDEFDTH